MIILRDRNILHAKVLLPVHSREWRTPSQAQEKNSVGHENRTRFHVTARLHDGHVIWRGWFDDREDFDTFLWSMATGEIRYDRFVQRLPVPWFDPDLLRNPGVGYSFLTVQFITTTGAFTTNSDCSGISGQTGEFLDAVGAGASGGARSALFGNQRSTGGGAGEWRRITSLALSPSTGGYFTQAGVAGAGATCTNNTGFNGNNGTASWFNKSANSAPASTANGVLGNPGLAGQNANTNVTLNGGTGGSGGVGTTGNNGGRGGNVTSTFTGIGATGGGGAALFNGVGNNGVDISTATGSAGGSGDAGSGGAGGAGSTSVPGSAGGNGTEYDATHGAGGGSGGWGNVTGTGGNGGNYGGGGGGFIDGGSRTGTTGNGGPGLVILSYVPSGAGPAAAIFPNLAMMGF